MVSKKDIRKEVLTRRGLLSEKEWEEKSSRICKKLITHPFFLSTNSIYCYVDYRNEVGTKAIIEEAWRLGKNVAVPKIDGDEMRFYYIDSYLELQDGFRGIMEPNTRRPACDADALVIMPGVAFDKERNRIGYGKGYYDRFLTSHPSYQTISICFECQLVENILNEYHDIKPELLITEEKIYAKSIAK